MEFPMRKIIIVPAIVLTIAFTCAAFADVQIPSPYNYETDYYYWREVKIKGHDVVVGMRVSDLLDRLGKPDEALTNGTNFMFHYGKYSILIGDGAVQMIMTDKKPKKKETKKAKEKSK